MRERGIPLKRGSEDPYKPGDFFEMLTRYIGQNFSKGSSVVRFCSILSSELSFKNFQGEAGRLRNGICA